MVVEVDILNSQSKPLEQPHTRTVQQRRYEPVHPLHVREHRVDFAATEHHWQVPRPLGSREVLELAQLPPEDFLVQEHQRVQSLILSARTPPPPRGQVFQKPLHRACAHGIRRRAVAEQDEPTDPLFVALLGPVGIAAASNLGGEPYQQVAVSCANFLEATFAPAFLEIAQPLRCELPRRRRVVGIQLLGGVQPVVPVHFLASRRAECFAIQNPYRIDALAKLPARQPILAADPLKVPQDIGARERLDFAPLVRLNELLDALDVPASMPLGHLGFFEAAQ